MPPIVTEYPGGHRRVLSAVALTHVGQVRLQLDGLFVRPVAFPVGREITARDVRHMARELIDAHTIIWLALSDMLMDAVVLYVDAPEEDGNTDIVLGIAPPGDHNAFSMIHGLGNAVNYLRQRGGYEPIADPEISHARLVDPDALPRMGWTEATQLMVRTLCDDLVLAFNLAIEAETP